MTNYFHLYNKSTGLITAYGPVPYVATPRVGESTVVLEGTPSARHHRINHATGLRRDATATEIAAYDEIQASVDFTEVIERRELKALLWVFLDQFNPPATQQKFQAALAGVKQAWDTQPWE